MRGFHESRLGPKDQFGNPYGGNIRIIRQNELIFPMPGKYAQTARVSAFYDIGNVFYTGNEIKFYGPDNTTRQYYNFQGFGPQALGRYCRAVAGPPGAVPLQLRNSAERQARELRRRHPTWGDETESFQFSVGNAF